MTTRAPAVASANHESAGQMRRIEKIVRELDGIREDIARRRVAGRKIAVNIQRQHKAIRTILDRVEATL